MLGRTSAIALTSLSLGCLGTDKDSLKETGPFETGDTSEEVFVPATGVIGRARQAEDVFHPSIHLFTNFQSQRTFEEEIAAIKENLLGARDASTCYTNGSDTVQFAVQTEYIPLECSSRSTVEDCFPALDERLDAISSAGLPVHLLLSVHQIPNDGWLGVDWSDANRAFSQASTFMPYEPSLTNEGGPYDVLSESWQVPTIEHLVSTGRASQLSMIYVANEFGYISGGEDPEKQAAMAATVSRLLDNARVAAAGNVPIGVKFARLTDASTGWTPASETDADVLEEVTSTMAANGDVLGYDVYINTSNDFDRSDYDRLQPFLAAFPSGNSELSEFGRECSDGPTNAADFTDTLSLWSEHRGINAFAWYTGSRCYSIADADNEVSAEGEGVLEGLRNAGAQFLGVSDVLANPCE